MAQQRPQEQLQALMAQRPELMEKQVYLLALML
jgi:hypothetical protein